MEEQTKYGTNKQIISHKRRQFYTMQPKSNYNDSEFQKSKMNCWKDHEGNSYQDEKYLIVKKDPK